VTGAALSRLAAVLDQPTREQARDAAREELSRRDYRDAEPAPLLQLAGRLLRALGDLVDRAVGSVGDGVLARALLALLALGVVVLVVTRLARRDRPARTSAVFDGARTRTAAEHRAEAEAEAGQGRFAQAVRERLRAVVRELEARGVLDPRDGRTAGEVARDAGAAAPDLAVDLRRGTAVFDEVWYGGRPADRSSYDVLVALDDRVRGARLVGA